MSTTASFSFPPFQLDVSNEQLWRADKTIPLRRKTFAVLRYLVEHAGQLVTKDHLLDAVWARTYVVDAMPTLCIRELRKALGDDARKPQFIETVHGRGYRFIAKVDSSQHSVARRQEKRPKAKGKNQKATVLETQDSGFGAQHSMLVGREAELAQLRRWLDKALNGERQMVFVTGEPGIGKTTLIETFLRILEPRVQDRESKSQNPAFSSVQTLDPRYQTLDGRPWLSRGQCIEQHGAGEAFLPILDALGRLCRGAHGEQLLQVLRQHAPMWLRQLPSLIHPDEYAALQRSAQHATRERMLRELAEALEALARAAGRSSARRSTLERCVDSRSSCFHCPT